MKEEGKERTKEMMPLEFPEVIVELGKLVNNLVDPNWQQAFSNLLERKEYPFQLDQTLPEKSWSLIDDLKQFLNHLTNDAEPEWRAALQRFNEKDSTPWEPMYKSIGTFLTPKVKKFTTKRFLPNRGILTFEDSLESQKWQQFVESLSSEGLKRAKLDAYILWQDVYLHQLHSRIGMDSHIVDPRLFLTLLSRVKGYYDDEKDWLGISHRYKNIIYIGDMRYLIAQLLREGGWQLAICDALEQRRLQVNSIIMMPNK